jgi:uncharacterized protein YcfL
VRQVLPGFRTCLGACASHQFGLVMQHREEAVESSLKAGPVAAEKPELTSVAKSSLRRRLKCLGSAT